MIFDPDSPTCKYAFPDGEPPPLSLGAAATPSPAPPDALAIAVAAARTERDDRKAMKMEDRRGKLTPSQPVDGTKWRVRKHGGKPHYHTIIHIGAGKIDLRSFSDAEKEKAVKLWKAVQRAKPTSRTNTRKRKAEREAKHAAKRAKDVEKMGDSCQLERDVLNANRKALTKDGVLDYRVLMLQTLADAVVRIAAMPKGMYLRKQEKTCGKIQLFKNGKRRYLFNDVTGYANCLMVFQCQADNATFVAYGDDVEEAFKTRKCAKLGINISMHDDEEAGWVKDEPILDTKPWLTYLGKGDEAYVKLQRWLVEQCEKKTPPMPLCTIAEANSELGKKSAKEEAGIKAHIQAEHGGIVPDNDPHWKELPQHWRDNSHIYMLTEKQGDVVAYPEDSQNGKTDIYVYLKAYDYKRRQKWQYKSARLLSVENGLYVDMCTNSGKGQPKSNSYKDGDNDFYCAVCIDGTTVHYWTFSNAEMVEHTYIGKGAPSAFYVYTKDTRCAVNGKHAWTWEKHRSARIAQRAPAPAA